PQHPRPPLFPYTTLFRSGPAAGGEHRARGSPRRAEAALHAGGRAEADDRLVPAGGRAKSAAEYIAQMQPWIGEEEKKAVVDPRRSEEHTSELQSRFELVC